MQRVTIVATGEVVQLIHQGFDIVIIQYDNGEQFLLTPEEVGLKRRERPKLPKY